MEIPGNSLGGRVRLRECIGSRFMCLRAAEVFVFRCDGRVFSAGGVLWEIGLVLVFLI